MIAFACTPSPQPIHFGSDQCEHCRMLITEAEYASQLLNHQSKSYKFDSIECLAAFDLTSEERSNIHSMWVPDFINRDIWIDAELAIYLHSETLRSPMGLFISSYQNKEDALQMQHEYGGQILTYSEVLSLVEKSWFDKKPATVE